MEDFFETYWPIFQKPDIYGGECAKDHRRHWELAPCGGDRGQAWVPCERGWYIPRLQIDAAAGCREALLVQLRFEWTCRNRNDCESAFNGERADWIVAEY